MNKKYLGGFALGVIIIALIAFAAHKGNTPIATNSSKLNITTSFYPLYYFASQIGGDKAVVSDITPAGAEPHDYEPTPSDMANIQNSALLFIIGPGLESWGDKIQQNIDPAHTKVVVVGKGLTTQTVTEDGVTGIDPHIWQSPVLTQKMVDVMETGFASADSKNADYYRANADALKTKLVALDQDYRAGLTSCTEKNIITSHAAFGYLATTYGLNQVPISGLSPDAEPSPKQLADIAAFAKAHKVQYIFFEALVSPKLSQTVATEIGAKTLVLDPIEGLTPDEIAAGQDYLSVMRNNLANLRIALRCQ